MLDRRAVAALLGVLPLWTTMCGGTRRAVGHTTPDLEGHLWTVWHAMSGSPGLARRLSWPDGVDLIPILGGWADILLASTLAHGVGVVAAYNLTMGLFLLLAGIGGYMLARALGLAPAAAVLCGLLLQLDPATLQHLWAGRAEQVGVGVLAVFLAAGLQTHRSAAHRWTVLLGLSGAAALAVAWEFGLFVAAFGLALVVVAPDAAARRRVVLGGALAVLVAAPAVSVYASHSASAAAGRFAEDAALRSAQNAVQPGVFHTWSTVRPATLPALCLLAVPWSLRHRGTRLLATVAIGLVAAFVLALGPEPAWGPQPPTGVPTPWAPFSWLARLPGLSRYQTPARLMAPWSLAAPVAAAAAFSTLSARRPSAGLAVGAVLLTVSLAEVAPVLPRAGHTPTDWSSMTVLREDVHPGGIYDLPTQLRGGRTIRYQQAQTVHERGIRHHSLQPYLVGAEPPPDDPFAAWSRRPTETIPADAVAHLQAQDFGFVIVHEQPERGHDPSRLDRALRATFGPPAHSGPGWQAWRVPTAP